MSNYEDLISLAHNNGIEVVETDLGLDKPLGKCIGDLIIINNRVAECERFCVLAEELGHHKLTVGDISDLNKTENIKQEKLARRWAYENIISLDKIINCLLKGLSNPYELSEELHVTEAFLKEALQYYKDKYGIYYVGDKHLLIFEPLHIVGIF